VTNDERQEIIAAVREALRPFKEELKTELKAEMQTELLGLMETRLRNDLRGDMGEMETHLRDDLRGEMGEVETRLRGEIDNLQRSLASRMTSFAHSPMQSMPIIVPWSSGWTDWNDESSATTTSN
jgi:hypothetical protein